MLNNRILTIENNHWVLEAISLKTVTDHTDDLVLTETAHPLHGSARALEGNIFFLCGLSEAYVIISFNADFEPCAMEIRKYEVYISEGDHVILQCAPENCEETVRKYLLRYVPERLITMSNTWGDRNGFSRVNRDFVKKEIDAGEKIGLDIMQIDDGWQKGKTDNLSLFDSCGFRRFDGDFWETDLERFPETLKEITEYRKTIASGLWFAPDFHDNFAHYQRDVEILKNAHKKWDFSFFKLDMLNILNKEDKDKFISMLEELKKFSSLELDVTNGKRLGYLLSLKYGIIFVENRYTKDRGYYTLRTHRNLWQLSKYVPAQCLQFEIVNPDLNDEVYGSDPYRPKVYSLDYIFASVMVSNPLFWMETQFLSDERIRELDRIFPLWKELRQEFIKSEIIPIGEMPDGRAFTGFKIAGENSYAVVFREDNEEAAYDFNIESFTVLASNGTVTNDNGKIRFSQKNCYALLKI